MSDENNVRLMIMVRVVDYDTHETVTCTSHYIYDLERQRSLQHFLQIEKLPAKFKQVAIPSGQSIHPTFLDELTRS